MDWTRDRIDFPSQVNAVLNKQHQYNSDIIAIEEVAYQAALPQALRKYRLPVRGVKATRDKVTKIQGTFLLFEQGMVHLPDTHPLKGEFENEYAMFPSGKHDDMLDATELAISQAMYGHNAYTNTKSSYDFSKRKKRQSERRR
jgi:predicted phage terminase large subunit-like protein